jgi:5-methylthioadenosine/S-adenosylhomocysteine deaminase
MSDSMASAGPFTAYLAAHKNVEDRNRALEPYMAEIHRRATLCDIGLNRYARDSPTWPRANRG